LKGSESAFKKIVAYQPHVISYVDILGFQEIVQTRSAGYISKLIRILQSSTRPNSRVEKDWGTRYQNFSDLCVIATPIRSPTSKAVQSQLELELRGLASAQLRLLHEGVFLRGAVTVGLLVKSYNVLYGPGLIAAYRAEQSLALYPRIVVTDDAFNALRSELETPSIDRSQAGGKSESVRDCLRVDEANVAFIDYLRLAECERFVLKVGYPHLLQTHKSIIEANLFKFRGIPRVREKYEWLWQYHDDTARRRFEPIEAARFFIAPHVTY
jgi:hypothetical protein